MKKVILWTLILIAVVLILLCIFGDNETVYSLLTKGKRDYQNIQIENIPIKKTPLEAQKEIENLLNRKPIKFKNNGYLLEDRETLDKIVSILQNTIGNIVVEVSSHSDKEGTSRDNRKLTQRRADTIASYIKDRCDIRLVNAIGYGEEFPIIDSNKTSERIKIYLRRIYE